MTRGYATGADFGGELCKALNLDAGKVKQIVVNVDAGEVATVAVVYLMPTLEALEVAEVVRRYALVPHPDEPPYVEPRKTLADGEEVEVPDA